MQTSHSRRGYDYRIQEVICETRDSDHLPDLEIPRSTIWSRTHRGVPDVVTSDLVARERAEKALSLRTTLRIAALSTLHVAIIKLLDGTRAGQWDGYYSSTAVQLESGS